MASPVAVANTRSGRMPMRLAVVASSEVARNARPSAVRWISAWSAAITMTAEAKVRSGRTPSDSGPTSTEAVASAPAGRRRESAEAPSSSAFCSAIESPKVTSKGGRMSSPSARSSTWRCRSQPAANMSGAATSAAAKAPTPSSVTTARIR